jgi:hypothetical protein
MRKVVILIGGLALVAWSALAAGTAKKLSAYGFVADQGDAALIVDVDMARWRGFEKVIPLGVVLGHTEAKTLHADRGSFTLTDPQGQKHPMASPEVVLKEYGPNLLSGDYAYYRRLDDYASMRFLSCHLIHGVAFFANPSGNPKVLYDHVELPNRTFFKALLYFPNPGGELAGTYTLSYDDPASGTHIDLPFVIPWKK